MRQELQVRPVTRPHTQISSFNNLDIITRALDAQRGNINKLLKVDPNKQPNNHFTYMLKSKALGW